MAKTREKVRDSAGSVRPYVERAIKDDELRENVRNAFESAREVYNELIGGRGVVAMGSRIAADKEMQDNLKDAIDELRTAARRLQGKEEHTGRNTMLLLTGITLGILFNPATGPATRRWLSDRLFGGSDDFTYQGGGNGSS
jgi:hypothetical protein